jgi:hypothetical protein
MFNYVENWKTSGCFTEYDVCVLLSTTMIIPNIFCADEHLTSYAGVKLRDARRNGRSVCYFCPILTKVGFRRHVLLELPNTKFY